MSDTNTRTTPGSLQIIIFKLNLVTFVSAEEGDGAAPAKTVLYHHSSTVNQTEPGGGVRDFRGVAATSDGPSEPAE